MSKAPNAIRQPIHAAEQEPQLVYGDDIPEIYVDGYAGSVSAGGIAKFPFFSLRYDPQKQRHVRQVVMTVTMPIYVVEGVHQAMGQFMEQFRNMQAGLKP